MQPDTGALAASSLESLQKKTCSGVAAYAIRLFESGGHVKKKRLAGHGSKRVPAT
jgi:hypothetical protein